MTTKQIKTEDNKPDPAKPVVISGFRPGALFRAPNFGGKMQGGPQVKFNRPQFQTQHKGG
jgi:hypothetical protein